MKKIYSIVLMATALLIGTTASAATVAKIGTTEYETFEAAWKAAQDGDVIQLQGDITIGTTLWLGTATMADANPLSITLDLNGDTLTSTAQKVFVLTHGSLTVKNGVIEHAPTGSLMTSDGKEYNSAIEVFRVYGSTYKDVDSKTAAVENLYTHLTIESGARIIAAVNGITVDKFSSWDIASAWAAGNVAIPTTDAAKNALYTDVYASGNGVAHGVCIDVKGYIQARKYAIKSNGNLRTPDFYAGKIGQGAFRPSTQKSTASGDTYVVEADDANNYSPFIHVYSTAKLLTTETKRTDAVAAYSAGYARWLVEGTVEGSTAVYVKSGDLDIKSAIITSNFNGTRTESTTDRSSGVDAGGSGVAIESSANYGGDIDVSVGGSTVITPTKGYALDEILTNQADTSKVNNIEINGGTFIEGDAGTIKVTQETTTGSGKTESTSVVINGGTFEFADNTSGSNTGVDLGGKTLEQFLTDQAVTSGTTHTVVVDTDDQGHQTIVISDGNPPVVANSVIGAAQDASINWKNEGTKTETLTADKKLAELQISQDYNQTLIIPTGKTLEVGRVVLGAKAQIIVKPGAKFIVTGNQGIAAFQASNLILEADEVNQATFLLDPAVTSNAHPMAKVQYQSNSFYSDHNVQQFFGIPTYNGAVTNIETTSDAKIYFDLWRNPGWDYIGAINVPGDPNVMANLNKFNLPFGLVCITSKNNAANKPVFTFSGELTGNMDHSFTLQHGWTAMSNAYMGPIDKTAILNQLAAWNASYGTEQSVYTYDLNESTGAIQWHARSKYSKPLPNTGLNAMAPIMFHNGNDVDGVVLDYSTLVWDPYVNSLSNPAPKRREISNITKVQINIAGENEADYTTIVADGELGNDRSFCAPKYDNAGLQLYVMGNEKYDIYATDEIESSYIGYRTVNTGMYTISFEDVQGEELVLVDLVNGTRTNMAEGAIYTFYAEANEANDYRFQVVAAAKMPTSIDQAEADASAKKAGVYTLTGQYLGNASIFNALPAGVYVVDGVKKVK